MFKIVALFAVVACASGQGILKLNPLNLGSTAALDLQTINLAGAGPRAIWQKPIIGRAAYAAPAYAYAAPQLAYAAPQIAYAPATRWAAAPQLALRDEAPEPYTFAFTSADEFGTQLGRQEQADGSGAVTGSYSLAEADGRQRIVEYVADAAGFRANIRTNEPGTANANPADVVIQSSAPSRR